jgi:hypothetical protein
VQDAATPLRNRRPKEINMPSVAFAAPLLPGKTEQDRNDMQSCGPGGERHAAYQASRVRNGITRECVWTQPTPGGDVAVVYIEADDLQAAFTGLGSSQDPFDVWFRDHVRDVHGMNLEDGFPPPEQILDFRAALNAVS